MIWIIIIGQALISAVLCGVIADSKKRDIGGWAILGFFFGLFALIAAVGVAPLQVESVAGKVEPTEGGQEESSPFDGERNLANDAYRLWLAASYGIQRNEVFNSFVIGERLFSDLEQALAFAHSLEMKALEEAESAAIAKAEAEERKRQLREQEMAQAAEQAAEAQRIFWRRDIWAILAVVFAICGAIYYFARNSLREVEQIAIANRSAVAEILKEFNLPLYSNSSRHEPKGYADIWCDQWKGKKPKAVEFRAETESANVEYFYESVARKEGYEKDSLEPIYRREDGRAFELTTISRDRSSDVIICVVQE